MKKLFFLFPLLFLQISIHAQIIYFPDLAFKSALLQNFVDQDGDQEISVFEAFYCDHLSMRNMGISDLEGLQYFTNLTYLDCSENKNVSNLNLISAPYLHTLMCFDMSLTSLNLSGFPNLSQLSCDKNSLTTLDASGLSYLGILSCDKNQLTSISVAGCSMLEVFYCAENNLTSIDFTGLNNLEYINCSNNSLSDIGSINAITSTALKNLNFSNNQFSGNLNLINTTNLLGLNCSNNLFSSINVLAPNLTGLECSDNQITSLNLTQYTMLTHLRCARNQLTSLMVYSPSIKILDFKENQVSNVNLAGGCALLEELYASNNQLSTLDLSGAVNLAKLYIDHNNFTQYNSMMPNREIYSSVFDCSYNNLTTIDISNVHLSSFNCSYNQLTEIIQNPEHHIQQFSCAGNSFTTFKLICRAGSLVLNGNPFLNFINLKESFTSYVYFQDCPNLRYICVKDAYNNESYIQQKINQYGYTDCHVNSYCSFNPGGTYNTITGNAKYDINNNGCDDSDTPIKGIRLNIAGGAAPGTTISGVSGSYSVPVADGSYTVTPTIENPNYFNITPASFAATFPTQASPLTQDICISPIGVHPDLEVMIVPLGNARPGFNSTYKIIYKNKGNQTQSGTISLAFNDAVLDFLNANPAVASQGSNTLNWDYVNLTPMESREISLTTNTNSPMETPPVNGGDILNFTASILSAPTDETPSDNTFTLNQTVVNSFDPNDKTCLEGNTITPEMVGKDVHYLIRFENTGTANAENVVVKDLIDTAKFDISSLIPIDGSHPFVTRISNTNKVEFIFENINLPFDDANNDGYVAFKIKTKPTLVLGDSFSNTASIYFDYNFPIITDPAVTTVALLGNSDFAFDNYFSIYPNPADDVLNIETKKKIDVTSISIYNTLGQVILVNPNAQQTKSVDVSSLKSGNYFLKINSDKGSSSVKFVKN